MTLNVRQLRRCIFRREAAGLQLCVRARVFFLSGDMFVVWRSMR